MNKKTILIVGSGSIALKHYKNLSRFYNIHFVSNRENFFKKKIKFYKNIKTATKCNEYYFSIIANQTKDHLKTLKILISKKIHIYCEKPIFHKKFNFLELGKQLDKYKLNFYCGYQLQQNYSILFLEKFLKKKKLDSFQYKVGYNVLNWRKAKIRKDSYFLNKKLGGGVIFELVHEINIIKKLFGKIDKIFTFKKNSNKPLLDCEDIAVSIIKTKKNYVGTLYQDMLSPIFFRELTIISKSFLINYDLIKDVLKINGKLIKVRKKNDQLSLLKRSVDTFVKIIENNDKNYSKNYFESIEDLKTLLVMHNDR